VGWGRKEHSDPWDALNYEKSPLPVQQPLGAIKQNAENQPSKGPDAPK